MLKNNNLVGDFRQFIARGNVIDMAVGIIMGAAFTTIVKSLVDDVIMPIIGVATNGVNFSSLFVSLDGKAYESIAAAKTAGAATLNYGLFINAVINFLIVAMAVFFLVKMVSRLKRKAEDQALPPKTDPEELKILREIRDLLKK